MSLAIKWQNLLTDEELSNRYFGEHNQVSVLGYFKDGSVNRYVIHCDEFPSRLLCLRAERECKQTLVCGVITKLEMKDGYTETTQPSNLNSIIEIYERNGGVFCP